jgi:outer membrane protein TolC
MITAWQEGRITDHRTPATSPQEAIAALESGLAQEQQALQKRETNLASAQANVDSIKNTLNILMKLGEKPVDPQSFVLAIVCTRTPKCPNPDPLLFGKTDPSA